MLKTVMSLLGLKAAGRLSPHAAGIPRRFGSSQTTVSCCLLGSAGHVRPGMATAAQAMHSVYEVTAFTTSAYPSQVSMVSMRLATRQGILPAMCPATTPEKQQMHPRMLLETLHRTPSCLHHRKSQSRPKSQEVSTSCWRPSHACSVWATRCGRLSMPLLYGCALAVTADCMAQMCLCGPAFVALRSTIYSIQTAAQQVPQLALP